LTTVDLQIEWRRLYQATPPTRLSRDLDWPRFSGEGLAQSAAIFSN
jgi:hypothetical protein